MKRIALAVVLVLGAASTLPAAGQDLDCASRIQAAQKAIDKITGDMKGMEMMPKDQLVAIHTLIDDAQMLLDGARHNCDKPQADYDLARAVAKAEAARGAAVAADMLHFHYMKSMPAMGGGTGMGGTSMSPPAAGGGHTHDMPGMKTK